MRGRCPCRENQMETSFSDCKAFPPLPLLFNCSWSPPHAHLLTVLTVFLLSLCAFSLNRARFSFNQLTPALTRGARISHPAYAPIGQSRHHTANALSHPLIFSCSFLSPLPLSLSLSFRLAVFRICLVRFGCCVFVMRAEPLDGGWGSTVR